MHKQPLRVAVAGLGAVGLPVARRLDAGLEGLSLVAVAVRDEEKTGRTLAGFRAAPAILPLEELAGAADVVVECLPPQLFEQLAEPVVAAGRLFVAVSVGALLQRMDLVERARESGARILVPTGALLGLDAVRAAAEGRIAEVTLVTVKPPRGLAGAPYLAEKGIDLEGLTEPKLVFRGSAREGARGFPANVNVAAALSLAGIGPDATRLEIWADPTIERNRHSVTLEADSVRLTMTIENVPSPENPRSGRLTPLSVIATLKGLVDPLKIGT